MSWVDVWLIPKSLCCWWGGSVRWVNSLIRQLAMCLRQATFLHLGGAHSPSRLIVGRPERGFLGFVNTPSYQQPWEISSWINPAFCTTAYPLSTPLLLVFGGLFDGYAEDCWLLGGCAVVSLAVMSRCRIFGSFLKQNSGFSWPWNCVRMLGFVGVGDWWKRFVWEWVRGLLFVGLLWA